MANPMYGSNSFDNALDNVVGAREILHVDTTISKSDSGKLFFVDGGATGVDVTLPAPELGLKFDFIVTDTSNACTIVTAGSSNIIKGFAVEAEDAGDAASSHAAGDTITFVASDAGTGARVSLECDGVYWYALGITEAADKLTVTQAG